MVNEPSVFEPSKFYCTSLEVLRRIFLSNFPAMTVRSALNKTKVNKPDGLIAFVLSKIKHSFASRKKSGALRRLNWV